MNATMMQTGMWIAAGAIMMFFLRRRRSRKNTR